MNNNWQKVREVFDAALRRHAEERANFVIQACGGDKNLLAEVQVLLASLDDAESFLEMPAVIKIADEFENENTALQPGQVFSHYEILEKIGAGGMGEVYLSQDTKLDRKVAVKVLNKKFSQDESNLRRFVREARSASALNHPNILVIHEIGESDDANYIVSEFVEGETLRSILRRKNLPLAGILDIAIQIAGALEAAHRAKIIHRDIKPENVIVRPDNLAKILDFGLAKLVEQKAAGLDDKTVRQNETEKGIILGTVNYMSPEQAKGEQVDERTDIFSFGVMLYEMIAGRTPFAGDSKSETFANLIKIEPPPLSKYSSNIPEGLQRVVSKTLRKNADERYQTMSDVLTDLKDLRENLTLGKRLEKSRTPESENATASLQAMTGDTNFQTAKTQSGFSQLVKRHNRGLFGALAVLFVSTIVLGYYFYATKSAGEGGKKSIAVLPLKPIGAVNRDEIYEVGIADSVIQRLGASKGFVVRPLSAVRRYAETEDPITAGREQQVDYVLASNYQIANGKIRITSQLINVATGQSEESYKSEKDAGNIFAMQDAVANEIGNLLQAQFKFTQNNSAAKNRGTENEEAYRLYLQGVYFNDKRLPPDGAKAVEFFEKAVQADPNYARAWAGVAFAHRSLMDIGADVDYREQHRISMEAVNKALALDPNLSEAYNALCINKLNYEYDFDGAETACRRAIELDPNSPLAHNTYSRLLFSSGKKRFDEAIAEIKTAIDLDPTSFYHQIVYTVALTFARRYDEAAQQLERLGQRNAKRAVSYFWLVGGVAFQGRQDEDFERLTRFQKLAETDEETVGIYKTAYQTGGWQGVLRQQAKRSFGYNPMIYFSACLDAQSGDKDTAIEHLEKSLERREHWMAYIEVDPRFDSLRGDPRFVALAKKVGAK